ncbi:sensor histidine kinase [Paenibacillus sp. PAMC21692]|uniref:cache domain-containing sensor histidine kinase n=1 Tax=Paenibacillus sp. PAMC21692 TaxID=2762320 RepID=UPI00164EBDE3|nr:histidine kinase [Paenibacillus sp. PAMC21692]QNK57169.1 histidine kinase [Paenibacillus sp. PAMC21692]
MMRSNLTFKIFMSFVTVILLALTITSFSIYVRSSAELERNNEAMLSQIVNNALHHTDLYLEKYERATLSVLTSSLVNEFLELNDGNVYQYYSKSNEIIDRVFRPVTITNPEIAMVYLLGYNGKIITDFNNVTAFKEEPILESLEELKQQTREDGRMTVMDYSFIDGTVALTRKIAVRQTSRAYKGILGIEMRIEELKTLWQGINLGNSGYLFIVNDRGRIIYHPNARQIGKQLNGDLFTLIMDHQNSPVTTELDGVDRVFYNKRSDFSGWTLVASRSLDELRKPIVNVRQTTFVSAILTCLVALLVAFKFGRSFTKPIQMLVAAMRETEKGNWTRVPLLGKKDERDRLILSYNIMVDRLSGMVDQVYKSELENRANLLHRKTAEFQALQLQINPHFMYNTLETIVSYAIIQDSKEIREIVRALAYMLRYAIRTNLEEVTVANELKHLLHYMTIMNHRFEREFPLDVAIPSELLLEKMVTLTLQPVVENAFKHAFPDGIEEYHTIHIDAKIENDLFLIAVSDNGAGMSAENLSEIQSRLKSQEPSEMLEGKLDTDGGIGLLNVHSRIRMVFGDEYGLSVTSEPGEGTTVLFRMPAVRAPRKLPVS